MIATRSGAALRSRAAAGLSRAPAGSKLDPFKDEIHRLLQADPKLPGQRVRELIEPLGYAGGKTIVDDYLREVRPLFAPPPGRFSARSIGPGEVCQFDLWEPRSEVPVGHGQTRRGWVVSRAWATRARAPACWSSPSRPRICCSGSRAACGRWARCRRRWSGIARPASTATAAARRRRSPAFCGQLRVGWRFCEPADPQAKGVVERLQGYAETNFEPGRCFANELDFQDQLDAWFAKVNARTHKTLRGRPIDRLADERERWRRCPSAMPDTAPGAG